MMIYFVVLILILVLGVIELITEEKRISIAVGTGLALMAGLRYYTGYDFVSYQEYYHEAYSLTDIVEITALETGYLILSIVSSRLGFTYYTFVLFLALVSLGLLTYYLYKYFPYPTVAFAYYYARFYHLRDMAQVRSSLASIILLFAIPFIKERKFWKFMGIVAIAMLFHSGSFVFVLAYIMHVLFEKMTVKNTIFLMLVAMALGLLIQFPQIYEWAVPQRYISYVSAPSRMGGPWYTNPIVLMQLMIYGASLLFVDFKDKEEREQFDVLLKIYYMASLALVGANTLRVLGGRISTFLATVEMLIVPYLILSFTKNKLLNILAFIGFTTVVFILIFIASGRYEPYLPYRTIF